MIIYIFLFVLILFFCFYIDFSSKRKINNKIFYFLVLLLSLVAGIRYHIGSDTANYIYRYSKIEPLWNLYTINLEDLSQPLWFLLNSIFKSFSQDFLFLQLFHAFIVNFLIGRFILKTCKKPFIALLAYFCTAWWNFNFEVMRESLCVAFYLNFFLSYLKDNDIKKFILYSFPLMLIHYFAFIPILLTVFVHFFDYKKVLIFGCIFTLLLYNALNETFVIQLSLLLESSMDSSDAIERMVQYGSDDSRYGFKSISILGYLFIFLTELLYPYLVSKEKKINKSIAKIFLLYTFFVIIRLKLIIVSRFFNYWDVILIVFALNYIFEFKKRMQVIYLSVIFIWNIISGINSFMQPLEDDPSKFDCRYIPYSSYIDKSINRTRESLFYWK